MSYLCGCYYHVASTDYYIRIQKHYLPLLNSEVHSTILSTTSRTVLKQTFTNPSSTDPIKECIYTFPLYDGVSVVSFTCRIGEKVLTGLVKEKAKAKKIFDQAVAKGETAGLLEQVPEASDVFSTKLGNIPAGESVIVEVTYIGELKHHESEGIRFTIPTKIAPRYGSGPSHGFSGAGPFSSGGNNGEIKIVVDVNMPEGTFIKGIQSPSHPIAVSMGTVSTATNDQPTMSKASATLSLGSAALEQDFVLIAQSKDIGTPKAILETHPTIPNHRALMATLVPKFTLPPSRSEIVFVADRSGSMGGNIDMLVSAMKVFLKSLPQSVKFNICSFGSSHRFLWEKSKSNSRETLEEAITHISHFRADMGGTETFGAIQGTVERRLTDIPLEIILLTDGDIYRQNDLFEYVNQQVEKTKGNVRVFPLGIGNGVSHALIEGLARAGNGFAQAVQHGERLDNAVVRMLRGALSPHITDYTLEVKYEPEIDDDFEFIDRVTEGMKVLLTDDTRSLKSSSSTSPTPKPTISLFDASSEPEKDPMEDIQETTFFIPPVPSPKLLQAPHKIPSLFAFSRTTVYLLMSPETIQRKPIAVVLRGTSDHGPLALEIPVETIASPAETIHQLAAKKAIQDLEEGRGWIYDAKDQNGMLIKDKYPSSFDDIVQREAVRLGEKFQIAGKWCSFAAVAANDKEIAEKKQKAAKKASFTGGDDSGHDLEFNVDEEAAEDYDVSPTDPYSNKFLVDTSSSVSPAPMLRKSKASSGSAPVAGRLTSSRHNHAMRRERVGGSTSSDSGTGFLGGMVPTSASSGLFGSSPTPPPPPAYGALYSSDSRTISPSSALFGSAGRVYDPASPALDAPYPQQQQQQQQGGMLQVRRSLRQQQQSQGQPQTRSSNAGVFFGPAEVINPSEFSSAPLNPPASTGGRSAGGFAGGRGGFAGSRGGFAGGRGGFGSAPPPAPSAPMLRTTALAKKKPDHENHARTRKQKKSGSSSPEEKSMAKRVIRRFTPEEVDEDEGDEVDDLMVDDPTPIRIYWSSKSTAEKVLALIDLQDFEGYWPAEQSEEISRIVGVKLEEKRDEVEAKIFLTILVVKFLEEKCGDEEGTWGLIVEKARSWIAALGVSGAELEDLEKQVVVLMMG